MTENGSNSKSSLGGHLTQILTVGAGALVLGLQGLNLSELGSVGAAGDRRGEHLEELLKISKDLETSLANQTKILETVETSLQNQNSILANDEKAFGNQSEILKTLQLAIQERRELLKATPTPTPENH